VRRRGELPRDSERRPPDVDVVDNLDSDDATGNDGGACLRRGRGSSNRLAAGTVGIIDVDIDSIRYDVLLHLLQRNGYDPITRPNAVVSHCK